MTSSSSNSPIEEIFRTYWKYDWRALLLVAAIVLLSSVSGIAAPYLFSRLVNRLTTTNIVSDLLWALMLYAALVGISSALQRVVQYLSVMTAENLGFIVITPFFEQVLKDTPDFFVEHNSGEILTAGNQRRGALTAIMQIVLIVFISGATQVGLTLITLGALLNLQVVAIVGVYGLIVLTLTYVSTRRSQVLLDDAVSAGQDNARFIGNAMNAMETLRHLGGQAWMSKCFAEEARVVKDRWQSYILRRAGTLALLGLGLSIQFAVNFLLLLTRYQARHDDGRRHRVVQCPVASAQLAVRVARPDTGQFFTLPGATRSVRGNVAGSRGKRPCRCAALHCPGRDASVSTTSGTTMVTAAASTKSVSRQTEALSLFWSVKPAAANRLSSSSH
jgi:ATP-binding cassette, subfamily B, bacterial